MIRDLSRLFHTSPDLDRQIVFVGRGAYSFLYL